MKIQLQQIRQCKRKYCECETIGTETLKEKNTVGKTALVACESIARSLTYM